MEPILWGKRRLIYATVGSHSRSSNFCGMQLSWSCLGNRVLSLTCRWSKGLLYFTCWDVKTHWSGGILSHPGVYFGWIAIISHIWRCVQSVGLRWSLVPNVEYDIFMFGPNDALIYCVCWNVKIHRLVRFRMNWQIFFGTSHYGNTWTTVFRHWRASEICTSRCRVWYLHFFRGLFSI